MTICVGAFAEDSKAIVCVADKSVTYGEDITGDADASKIFRLRSGVVVMVSGSEPDFERYISKLSAKLDLGKNVTGLIRECENAYLETRAELLQIRVLNAQLMDEKSLHRASMCPEPNDFIKTLMKQVADFRLDCYLILCGFDENGCPFMVHVSDPGEATDNSRLGYDAIGSGWQYAITRLICWSDIKSTLPIDQALFCVLDAKISAEASPFISGDWNAFVVTRSKFVPVPKDIISVLDKAWVRHNRSPYWKKSEDDLDNPPKNWRDRVEDWAKSVRAEG